MCIYIYIELMNFYIYIYIIDSIKYKSELFSIYVHMKKNILDRKSGTNEHPRTPFDTRICGGEFWTSQPCF